MRKVVLFIAMSLDGFIADAYGHVDWLSGQRPNEDDMRTYKEFIKGVDSVVMGWKTYHQIVTELSVEDWFYKDLNSFVITHHDIVSNEKITAVHGDICAFIETLKKEEGKNIWICGGADVVRQLMKQQMIDRYHISIIPIILGDGVRLFSKVQGERKLKLVKTESYNGIVDVVYEQR